MYLESSGIN